MDEIRKPSLERKWLLCPYCGAKTILYDNTAECSGVFLKCTRGCKQEFEIKIKNGKVH
ncbi:MAG: cysteine-rich KTR domain-containing protein [Ruminococcus flavefaciens]|nr:cysteine-rich KTR domain-containing protein [Ruminococcus flavefaciens]MCM1060568.1 cysteine-rich KTR domain-containing protein [Eubacterium sp.]